MTNIKELSEWELKNNPVINLKGDVLCPNCLINDAIVTEYGMIRLCEDCQEKHIPTTIHAVIKEHGKNKFY